MPGLASTTAAGLARRITPAQWKAVEVGLAAVTGRMLSLLPAERAVALTGGPVTIDLDTTDVEVYGRKKRGVAYNHQGQRVGRPHVAAWAGCYDSEGDACFGESHGGAFGSVEVGAGLDNLGSEGLG